MKKVSFVLMVLFLSSSLFPLDLTKSTLSNSFYIISFDFLPHPLFSLLGKILDLFSGGSKELNPSNNQKEGDGGGWIPGHP